MPCGCNDVPKDTQKSRAILTMAACRDHPSGLKEKQFWRRIGRELHAVTLRCRDAFFSPIRAFYRKRAFQRPGVRPVKLSIQKVTQCVEGVLAAPHRRMGIVTAQLASLCPDKAWHNDVDLQAPCMRMRADKDRGAAGHWHPGECNLEEQIDDRRYRAARRLLTRVEARHINVGTIE